LHFSGKRLGIKKVPVELATQHSSLGIVIVSGRTLSPLAQHFMDYIRAVAAPLVHAR